MTSSIIKTIQTSNNQIQNIKNLYVHPLPNQLTLSSTFKGLMNNSKITHFKLIYDSNSNVYTLELTSLLSKKYRFDLSLIQINSNIDSYDMMFEKIDNYFKDILTTLKILTQDLNLNSKYCSITFIMECVRMYKDGFADTAFKLIKYGFDLEINDDEIKPFFILDVFSLLPFQYKSAFRLPNYKIFKMKPVVSKICLDFNSCDFTNGGYYYDKDILFFERDQLCSFETFLNEIAYLHKTFYFHIQNQSKYYHIFDIYYDDSKKYYLSQVCYRNIKLYLNVYHALSGRIKRCTNSLGIINPYKHDYDYYIKSTVLPNDALDRNEFLTQRDVDTLFTKERLILEDQAFYDTVKETYGYCKYLLPTCYFSNVEDNCIQKFEVKILDRNINLVEMSSKLIYRTAPLYNKTQNFTTDFDVKHFTWDTRLPKICSSYTRTNLNIINEDDIINDIESATYYNNFRRFINLTITYDEYISRNPDVIGEPYFSYIKRKVDSASTREDEKMNIIFTHRYTHYELFVLNMICDDLDFILTNPTRISILNGYQTTVIKTFIRCLILNNKGVNLSLVYGENTISNSTHFLFYIPASKVSVKNDKYENDLKRYVNIIKGLNFRLTYVSLPVQSDILLKCICSVLDTNSVEYIRFGYDMFPFSRHALKISLLTKFDNFLTYKHNPKIIWSYLVMGHVLNDITISDSYYNPGSIYNFISQLKNEIVDVNLFCTHIVFSVLKGTKILELYQYLQLFTNLFDVFDDINNRCDILCRIERQRIVLNSRYKYLDDMRFLNPIDNVFPIPGKIAEKLSYSLFLNPTQFGEISISKLHRMTIYRLISSAVKILYELTSDTINSNQINYLDIGGRNLPFLSTIPAPFGKYIIVDPNSENFDDYKDIHVIRENLIYDLDDDLLEFNSLVEKIKLISNSISCLILTFLPVLNNNPMHWFDIADRLMEELDIKHVFITCYSKPSDRLINLKLRDITFKSTDGNITHGTFGTYDPEPLLDSTPEGYTFLTPFKNNFLVQQLLENVSFNSEYVDYFLEIYNFCPIYSKSRV